MTKKPYFAPTAEPWETIPHAVFCVSDFGASGENRNGWNSDDDYLN